MAVPQLIVTAADSGQDAHPVDATVQITVADVNDNPPTVTVNSLAAVGADFARVPENAPPGTFVAHITVVDKDAGPNGTVECVIVSGGSGGGAGEREGVEGVEGGDEVGDEGAVLFTLMQRSLPHQPEREYTILTTTELDREDTPKLNLSLSCADQGNPVLRSTKLIQVSRAGRSYALPSSFK